MSASLVGSEMCIRDSVSGRPTWGPGPRTPTAPWGSEGADASSERGREVCLLYTSDAADDM
eukprot:4128019-Alexandrium_andersonii.AAC.1